VQAWYAKNAPDQLQTKDCLDAWKAYLCSFYFPKVLTHAHFFIPLVDVNLLIFLFVTVPVLSRVEWYM
jgi:hypothetical protein